MNTQKTKCILGTVLMFLIVLLAISANTQQPVHAAPDTPAYFYSLSPTNATMSTSRVILSITGLQGEAPPSSTWYGPDGTVSQTCASGQTTRQYIYKYGSLFEVRDYFYISACSRDAGHYYVKVGSALAGSFDIWTYVYLPLVLTPPGPPGAFAKVSPTDGANGLNPLSLTLDWEDNPGTGSYAYCYDASDDSSCSNWVETGTDSQAEISGLSENMAYYWQVRATNSLGTSYANGADTAYWSFTTGQAYTGNWTQMTAAAEWLGRSSHASVVLSDGSIVLMGGYDGDNRLNDVWRSADQGATWTQMTAAAEWSARNSHTSMALPDDSIVLIGGYDGSNRLNDVWRSTDQGATWTQMTADAGWSGRSSHTSVVLPDGSVVVMGGSMGIDRLNDVWRSTDQGVTWTQMTAAAEWTGRAGHTSVALSDGSIVVMGGFVSGIPLTNDVWRSTDQGATWTQMTAAAGWSARDGHTSTVLPGGIIMLMGGPTDKSDAWISPDQGATWTQVSPVPSWPGRDDATSITLPDGSIVLMGGRSSTGRLNDVWRFEQTD